METREISIAFLSALLIVLGGAGSVLPVLPGPPLSFAGLWLYAWQTGYERISPLTLAIFGGLTILTFIIDLIAPALGARGYKASSYGVYGSMIGAFLGIFVLGPIGLILGPFIGGFAGELLYAKNMDNAWRVAIGSFMGFVIGSLFKIAVVVAMFGYFIYSLF